MDSWAWRWCHLAWVGKPPFSKKWFAGKEFLNAACGHRTAKCSLAFTLHHQWKWGPILTIHRGKRMWNHINYFHSNVKLRSPTWTHFGKQNTIIWCVLLLHHDWQCKSGHRAKSLHPYLTLCGPMDSRSPGSSVHGILQARILEWVAMPSSRGSSPPTHWAHVFYVSCIGMRSLLPESCGKPRISQEWTG